MKLDLGTIREPINSKNYKDLERRTRVVSGVYKNIADNHVKNEFMRKHQIDVETATRIFSRKTGEKTSEVKIVVKEEDIPKLKIEMQVGIQKCKIEPYRKKIPIILCYRCQRYGHIATTCTSETERCGRCSGDHKMRHCSSNVLKCSNCRGNHVSSDNICPKFQEVKQKIEGYRNSRIKHAQHTQEHYARSRIEIQQQRRLLPERESPTKVRNPQYTLNRHDIICVALSVAAALLKMTILEAKEICLTIENVTKLTIDPITVATGCQLAGDIMRDSLCKMFEQEV